ncbi:NAD(P)/FAD-dependent oxidoreductase [Daejeonella lutea]|uniref:Dehydrogenase (Flavoprotein) n=1 Tax=Daejeonella lutea TaxID=572036 RepID=A0A1T5DVJ5_9SPHI|nr:NAD(P)/FAD-dependent oxidoreductase [Daejeonella lutea]SKB75423.1 Dehydrogenase (flavoprotein) [Daejeonella lutea]
MTDKKVIIIGGGLSGLTCSILLQKAGFEVTVFEKKKYPFHRVCGEYISNEAWPFLQSLEINISDLQPSRISQLELTTVRGRRVSSQLDLGGFGLSRYKLDQHLFQEAKNLGVSFCFEKVLGVQLKDDLFEVSAENRISIAPIAIAAYGKRSNLDQKLKRNFFYYRSPYLGVKYHIKTDLPDNLIRLDNFNGGYSGVCKIEDQKFNLCYLSETVNLKRFHSIPDMEKHVLYKNPFLKHLLENSDFLYDKPEVINEISFEPKTLVENHLLFCGDSAGMITPLCGNGMAMAFHSAKILAESIIQFSSNVPLNRLGLEQTYKCRWNREFSMRLKSGRYIQRLFGSPFLAEMTIAAMKNLPALNQMIVKKTHGKVF